MDAEMEEKRGKMEVRRDKMATRGAGWRPRGQTWRPRGPNIANLSENVEKPMACWITVEFFQIFQIL